MLFDFRMTSNSVTSGSWDLLPSKGSSTPTRAFQLHTYRNILIILLLKSSLHTMSLLLLLLVAALTSGSSSTCSARFSKVKEWEYGWRGDVVVPVTEDTSRWVVKVSFRERVTKLGNWLGTAQVRLFYRNFTWFVLYPIDRAVNKIFFASSLLK